MASQAQRQHLARIAIAGLAVMHRDRPLPSFHRRAVRHAAAVVIPLQHCFTMPTKVGLVLQVTLKMLSGWSRFFGPEPVLGGKRGLGYPLQNGNGRLGLASYETRVTVDSFFGGYVSCKLI